MLILKKTVLSRKENFTQFLRKFYLILKIIPLSS